MANLLNNYLDSNQAQITEVSKKLKKIDFHSNLSQERLKVELNEFRTIIPYLMGTNRSKEKLLFALDELRDQLDEPDELIEYTQICVTELEKAIDQCLAETHLTKSKIMNTAVITIVQKSGILNLKTLVPKQFYDMIDKLNEENEV